MRLQFWQQGKVSISHSLHLKCGAIFLLFLLSVLIVACGSNSSNSNLGQPAATVTINLDQSNSSPTPPLPEYSCSAWTTNTSPGINTPTIGIYAKFVHNVNGNPQGVYPASGTATVLWPDGNTVNVSANTTSDGLAVFPVSTANRSADLNKIVLVTVAFQGPTGVPPCIVTADRAAFFTLVIATGTISGASSPTVGTTGTVTGTPTPRPTVSPTPCPKPKKQCH
ncbi:MAG: hypothetical protein E6J10_01520 [Chloroflexi bacterium]|nr:MAG: hypothetical protein E6J10_01520 [Chloroflexota bacterium]